MSSPHLPSSDAFPDPQPAPLAPAPAHGENPPWSGWDVLGIALVTIFAIVILMFAATVAAQRLYFPKESLFEVGKRPLVTIVAQGVAYLVVFAFMAAIAKRGNAQSVGQAIRWNWPNSSAAYLFSGVVLALGLQAFAHFLPMPKELPIDRFFQTGAEAWALSAFGVTLAPLFEELFFRGFLYPVLARRLGTVVAILLTAAAFGMMHVQQLGHAWGPVLIVFLVGLTLTITRALTKSVAAGLLIHVAYNGTIGVLIYFATGGFRHLEKLSQ